jgi:hypothetical protein
MMCAVVAPAAAEQAPMPAPSPASAEPAVPPAPGATAPEQHVEMVPTNERLVITYRWPRWVPWAVFGGGVAAGALGLVFEFNAASMMNEYDQRVASSCAVNGCNLDNPQTPAEQELADSLNDQRDTAERRQKIGFATLLVGGATVVTGIVLLVMNRPEAHVLKVDLVPTQGGAAASASWRF